MCLGAICAQAPMCRLLRPRLRWNKTRDTVHPLQASSSLTHLTNSLGSSQAPDTMQHSAMNKHNVALALENRICSRRQMSRVPSRTNYGLRPRYKAETRVRVNPYGII